MGEVLCDMRRDQLYDYSNNFLLDFNVKFPASFHDTFLVRRRFPEEIRPLILDELYCYSSSFLAANQ